MCSHFPASVHTAMHTSVVLVCYPQFPTFQQSQSSFSSFSNGVCYVVKVTSCNFSNGVCHVIMMGVFAVSVMEFDT